MYDIRYSLARANKAVAYHHHKRSSKMTMFARHLDRCKSHLGKPSYCAQKNLFFDSTEPEALSCRKKPFKKACKHRTAHCFKQLATSPSPPSNGKFFNHIRIHIQIHVHVHIDVSHTKHQKNSKKHPKVK